LMQNKQKRGKWLFPAGAGVILLTVFVRTATKPVPRRGGGDPWWQTSSKARLYCSPQGRG